MALERGLDGGLRGFQLDTFKIQLTPAGFSTLLPSVYEPVGLICRQGRGELLPYLIIFNGMIMSKV